MASSIASPYSIDGRGRTAGADTQTHLRDLIESVLFTSPGERVMRPTFGCGLQRLVFAPNSDQLAATLQGLGDDLADAMAWRSDLGGRRADRQRGFHAECFRQLCRAQHQ